MIINERFIKSVSVYEDITDPKSKIHAWRSTKDFPLEELNKFSRKELENIAGIEVSFKSVSSVDRYAFEDMYVEVEKFLFSFFRESELDIFLFNVESYKEVKNKVRSYKKGKQYDGIFDVGSYIHSEISLQDDYTLFGSLIKMQKHNLKQVFRIFMESNTSFILGTHKKEVLNEDFLGLIVKSMVNDIGSSHINFLSVISKFCLEDDIIYRIGGDAATNETDFQIFTQFKNRNNIMAKLLNELR